MRPIEIFAIQNMPLVKEGDNVAEIIVASALRQNMPIREKDIIVITHKIISKAEGNLVNLEKVSPSKRF